MLHARARCWLFGLLLVCGPLVQAQTQTQTKVSESQLRAGVVIGVLRFTSWSAPVATGILNICSLGETPGFKELAQSRSKIAIADKELIFKPLDNIGANDGCAAVIVGANVDKKKLATLKQLSVLSICDTCDQPDQHAVALFMNNQRIRFFVDRTLEKHAGVQFSAAMLELAAEVKP